MASVKRPGRRPLEPFIVAAVEALVEEHLSDRAIVADLAGKGILVARTSVQRIRTGSHLEQQPSTSRLAEGETRVPAARCPECGGLCTVRPCRVAAARSFFDRLRAVAGRTLSRA